MSSDLFSDLRYQQNRHCKRGGEVPNKTVCNWILRVRVGPLVTKRLVGCRFDNSKPAVSEPNLTLVSTRSRCFACWQSLGSLRWNGALSRTCSESDPMPTTPLTC